MTAADSAVTGGREVTAFLTARGNGEDRQVADATSPADVLVALSSGLWAAVPDVVARMVRDRPLLRDARRRAGPIRPWALDVAPLLVRNILTAWGVRCAVVAANLAVAALLGSGILQLAALAAFMVLLRAGRYGLAVVAVAAAVAVGAALWPVVLTVAAWSVTSDLLVTLLLGIERAPWHTRGPVLGFLPPSVVARLALRRRLTLMRLAVDLAVNGDGSSAQPFLDQLTHDQATRMPAAAVQALEASSAVVALSRGDLQQAERLASAAVSHATGGPGQTLAWCQGIQARVLATLGRDDDAAALRGRAAAGLSGRRTRGDRRRLRLEQCRRLARSGDPGEAVAALRPLRRIALRRADVQLLSFTELQLAELMLHSGNAAGATWTLGQVVAGQDARKSFYSTVEESTHELLVRGALRVEDADTRPDGRRDVQAAMAVLEGSSPMTLATARLTLARADELDGNLPGALSLALHALEAVHQARYGLASERARQRWEHTNLAAYALGLRLAHAAGEPALSIQLLELARGEVLPADTDAAALEALVCLETLEAGLEEVPVVAGQLSHLSLVAAPPQVVLSGRPPLFPLESGDAPLVLERQISATGGVCWYWSGCLVAGRYYWAVRSPKGDWHTGTQDASHGSAARQALDELRRALPLPLGGESIVDVGHRVARGPLARATTAERERDLILRLTRGFLPAPLAESLAAETAAGAAPTPGDGRETRLVVSLAGSLSLLPIAALVVAPPSDLRVAEVAAVTHVPAWSVVAARHPRRPRLSPPPRPGTAAPFPLRVALTGPDGDENVVTEMAPVSGAEHALSGAIGRRQVLRLLESFSDDPAWTLLIVGHVDDGHEGRLRGLRLRAEDGTEEWLTIHDFGPGAAQDLVPERVAVIGCGSLGLDLGDPSGIVDRPMTEWLGLGSGLILGGARDVVSALYPVYLNEQTARLRDGLAEGLTSAAPVWQTLQRLQVEELRRWRENLSGWPFLWQAYVHVGVGGVS